MLGFEWQFRDPDSLALEVSNDWLSCNPEFPSWAKEHSVRYVIRYISGKLFEYYQFPSKETKTAFILRWS
jgi:hypothetical protein